MTRIAALALLAALSPAASAFDWNSKDPVAQAEIAAPASKPGGGQAGQFQSFVFSLEWTPAFCEGKGGLPECAGLSSGDFAGRNLALHGLWPDQDGDSSHSYGYCGVDAATRGLDNASSWCRMPDIGLSGAVMSRLSTVMSGTQSCLQNHEWYKHGSCSGLTPDAYFTRASELVEFVARSSFGKFVTGHIGQTVRADDLLAAFEADFGAGTRDRVRLSCTKAGSATVLLDARLKLANPLQPAENLPAMLLSGPGAGNCPASFLIDPPAR